MGSEHSQAVKAKSFQFNSNQATKSAYKSPAQSFQQYPQPQQTNSFTQYNQNQVQYSSYIQNANAQPQNTYQQTQQQHQHQQLNEKSKRFSQYSQAAYAPTSINRNSQSISTQHLNQSEHYSQKTMSMVQSSNDQPTLRNSHYFTLPNLPDESLKVESNFKSDTNIYQKTTDVFSKIKSLNSQKLLVFRHGERVDTTFGPTWTENCFDATGRYTRFNLNMPKTLPQRDNPKFEYLFDPPLTEMGMHQAKLTGEELLSQGITITHCYSSPALRSIQTADKILEGMNLKNTVPIRVELGLFEFLRWQVNMPNKYPFMDLKSLIAAGYNIDLTYQPVMLYDMLQFDETEEIYYQRSYYMTRKITDMHSGADGENLMFVGHAPTIEVCTRQLCGGEPRVNEFRSIVRKVPFLAIAQCEKNPITKKWKLKKPQIPALKHLAVDEFDWKNLQNANKSRCQNTTNDAMPFFHYPMYMNVASKIQKIPFIARPLSYVPWRI